MAFRTLILGAAAALALTTTSSFADPAHSVTQLGERHVNYAAAQWQSQPAAPPTSTTTSSFADPAHSVTQLGERHVNYAAAQWHSPPLPAVPPVSDNNNQNQ